MYAGNTPMFELCCYSHDYRTLLVINIIKKKTNDLAPSTMSILDTSCGEEARVVGHNAWN